VKVNDNRVFPAALNLQGRAVLVVGGDQEAVQKVPKLLAAGAHVTIVAPSVEPALAQAAAERLLTWHARPFEPADVERMHVVMLTPLDPVRAAQLRALADSAHFWLCAIDQPAFSDFFMVSSLERGPVQIAISTGGGAPLLARRVRQALERGLDARFGEFARSFACLRASLRALPKAERMHLLERALDGFAMDVTVRYPESYPQDDGQGAGDPPDEAREK